jgi:PTS system mannose-specific IID component
MGRLDLLKVSLRLLFIQAVLNRRGMQNLGLVSALTQAGGNLLGKDGGALLARHVDYFNSNPNLVPLIVGAVLRLEEERLDGKPVDGKDIAYFKNAVASPFAAMGDLALLGGLRPLSLTLACVLAIYNSPIGLLAVFLLYNLTIIACRFWGLHFGYANGRELVEAFSGPRFPRVLGVIHGIGASVGGMLAGTVFLRFLESGPWTAVFAGALAAMTFYLLKRHIPASWVAGALFPVCALLALLLSGTD